ncbi:helix-turn-helix domain-containing protein [Alistipes onderdonkii]|jgi:transcriptional regulator with XRE-family HTH domain|uniref:helix-turn-helix domain-containing protein n=1 Tax=Alistipes onderdonkii TaxID=328813 RepID=UPI00189EF67F|nr:helix-turn-helix transcriptional regulator [Alistipes onderdonkii]
MRIKEILAEKGMTMADLAEKAKMQQPAISRAMTGNPTVETLERIASALEVNITELFAPKSNTIICPKCGTVLEVKERE